MGNIDWIAIADLPAALKDGREVLLAEFHAAGTANPGPGRWSICVAQWETFFDPRGYWADGEEDRHFEAFALKPTYFAELNPPT